MVSSGTDYFFTLSRTHGSIDILAHPQQLSSTYKIEELDSSVSDTTVDKHIQKRIDAGVVKEVALDNNQRRQGPHRNSTV